MRDFNHSVNVLVKAYLNNTLEHGNCCACAVGNLIADSMCLTYTRSKTWGELMSAEWQYLFMTDSIERIQTTHFDRKTDLRFSKSVQQVEFTGYTMYELAKVEAAFESVDHDECGYNSDTHMFNGLMAVVDVLADIHGIDLKQREEAKALFVK